MGVEGWGRSRRARKEMLESMRSQAPGIGPLRRQLLLKHYENLDALKQPSVEELAALPGFNRKAAQRLKERLAPEGRDQAYQ